MNFYVVSRLTESIVKKYICIRVFNIFTLKEFIHNYTNRKIFFLVSYFNTDSERNLNQNKILRTNYDSKYQ